MISKCIERGEKVDVFENTPARGAGKILAGAAGWCLQDLAWRFSTRAVFAARPPAVRVCICAPLQCNPCSRVEMM
jgi:hypothetical protein